MDPFRFVADGVVRSAPLRKASRTDHYYGFALSRSRFAPVCAAFVASRHLLDGAASLEASRYRARAPRPPLRGGEYDAFKFRPNGNVIAIGCGVAALCLLWSGSDLLGKAEFSGRPGRTHGLNSKASTHTQAD